MQTPEFAATPFLTWKALISVVFGGVVSISFRQFHETLVAGNGRSWRYFSFRLFLFFACFIFFVYDFAVLNKLIVRFPYREDQLSSAMRFMVDLVMAFLLFGITWYAGRLEVEERPRLLYVYILLWHGLAGLWHLLASWQYDWKDFSITPLVWHWGQVPFVYGCCLGFAWLVCRATRRRLEQDMPRLDLMKRRIQLIAWSFGVLAVSVARTRMVFPVL